MRTFDGGDDALQTAQVLEGVYRLIVGNGHVLSAARIVQPCMLRSDARIIKARADGVHRRNLTVLVLAEVRFHAMEHAQAARVDGSCCFERVDAAARRLAADKPHLRMLDEVVERAHGV